MIENYSEEFLVTLVETGAIDVSIEYPEDNTRDDLRAHIESMESKIETGDVSDPTVVSEITVARAMLDRIEHEEQWLTGNAAEMSDERIELRNKIRCHVTETNHEREMTIWILAVMIMIMIVRVLWRFLGEMKQSNSQ